jgi:hypothetical protein
VGVNLIDPRKNIPVGMQGVQGGAPAQIAQSDPYDYEYPRGLDLRPGSELHEKLKMLVLTKAKGSQDALQVRFAGWREIDRTLTTYIVKSTEEDKVKEKDSRKPVSVVVPVSYATIETLLTYWVAAFLEEPYFRYEGVGPEDVLGSILLEMIVAQQCRRSKVGLELHTMWRDSLAYGFGAVHVGWNKRTAYRMVEREKDIWSELESAFKEGGETEMVRERVDVFNGSTLTALDPYMCLPDPETPIHDVQGADFFGWVTRKGIMAWLDIERDNEDYFNLRYCKHFDAKSTFNKKDETGRNDKYGRATQPTNVSKVVDVVHMYIKLIPKDLGIGDEEYPEIWLVSLAGDQVSVRAQPLGLDHNMIPIAISAPDYDGHSITPISRLETVYGLQEFLDWQLNSRIANVRKAINDMLVVDPQLVNIHDLANPKPGKLIRLRRLAWGRGVKDAVMQLGVSDVTANNMNDVGYITQIIRESTGSLDVVSGIRRHTSERVSATEASQTARGALSRLEKSAKISSMQAHDDIAYQMARNTQQLMKKEEYARITGDWAKVLAEDFGIDLNRDRVAVSPKDLNVDFDVKAHDGNLPSSGDPELWFKMFQIIASSQELSQQIDAVRMFKFGARMAGAKNINDFVRRGGGVNAQVMPDQQVAEGAASGKLVPTG